MVVTCHSWLHQCETDRHCSTIGHHQIEVALYGCLRHRDGYTFGLCLNVADGIGIVNTSGDFSWQEGTMEGFANIYTLQGQCVKHHVPVAELRQHLAPGIYIVNGKKMVVK